jgi:serine/threonine protein kinase
MLAGVPEHKNIIRQFGWAVSTEYINIFLEHGGSDTLAQVQKRKLHQRFTMSHAMHLFYDVLQALLHLHRCGVCHLDIKPDNVVWGNDDVLRLVDFGSAAYIEDFVRSPCVTFPYAAPELLDMKFIWSKCRGDYADCFSMGVLLFNLAFGLSAFSEHLGWENTPTEDLVSDLGLRAAEMRELLRKRKALCEKMISGSDGCPSTREKYEDFLLPPLLAMLHPGPCQRMSLSSVHVHVRKYFRSQNGSSKKILNKRLHAVCCCSENLRI